MPRSSLFLFLFLLLLIGAGCGTALFNRSAEVSSYAARAAWQWQGTNHFLVRGRARLSGENQVFSGPFLLWASKELSAVRADFCGPDGSPLVSLLQDSTGCLVYYPKEEQAFHFTAGLPAGAGYLNVNAVISLIRTGFPAVPVQWDMVASCDTSTAEENRWVFVTSSSDTAVVSLEHSRSFPELHTDDLILQISASSWHDQFNAWPMEWQMESSSLNTIIRIRSYDTSADPPDGIWSMTVPVPIDTIYGDGGSWTSAFDLPIR